MSSATNESSERKKISKVSIAPISSDALVVRIRKFSTEVREEHLPQVSEAFRSIVPRPLDPRGSEIPKTNMADSTPKSSKSAKKKQRNTRSETATNPESPPCLKHAAENISRKASSIPSEKINLCSNCSKSMLSYIFLVQDFLDSLAKEIIGDGSAQCLQCAREEVRRGVASSDDQAASLGKQSKVAEGSSNQQGGRRSQEPEGHRPRRTGAYESRSPESASQQSPQFAYTVRPPPASPSQEHGNTREGPSHSDAKSDDMRVDSYYHDGSSDSASGQQQHTGHPTISGDAAQQSHHGESHGRYQSQQQAANSENQQYASSAQVVHGHTQSFERRDEAVPHHQEPSSHEHSQHVQSGGDRSPVFRSPQERVQPHYETPAAQPGGHDDPNNNYPSQQSPSLYSDDLDGIISTLSSVDREVYDGARNGAGWESCTENQERFRTSTATIASEAFVTSCRNNAEALGCLVVGTSLLLCRTSRTLCVLVSDGVSTAFRGALSTVFHVVQNVRSLDSLGTTKLALLEQPELGITFEKLNVWRLTQFSKCVYLNPDTLVIQNCDELFGHQELSAVPDIGWPDCFNSGVFVFSPSVHTFWALMEHADKQGSYDGGDQGLLNSYFTSWSGDISQKLSFVYNLMANVSYTYTPAFRQFGRNVKIVQFHGSFKPWHVKFFTKTGQVSPSSPVHPTYVQFVHIWLNIFRISVLRLMSKEIQLYASSQETICAVEILRFFPLPTESEAEFYLTPPSVRLRRAQRKLERPTPLPISEAQRRKSAEYSKYVSPDDSNEDEASESATITPAESSPAADKPAAGSSSEAGDRPKEKSPEAGDRSEKVSPVAGDGLGKDGSPVADEVFAESEIKKKVRDPNAIPGSDIGDYQGMTAWEQGRMDYEGTARSDNVLKRLQFLMKKPSNK